MPGAGDVTSLPKGHDAWVVSEKELLEIAVRHAVAVHDRKDTPEFREQLKKAFQDGMPPA